MSKDFAMAHAIKKMNKRKMMAEGGEVKVDIRKSTAQCNKLQL